MGRLTAAVVMSLGLALATAAPAGSGGPRAPIPGTFGTAYDIYVGGIWIGELSLEARVEAEAYRAEAAFQTTGLVGFFREMDWIGETTGRVAAGALLPVRYEATSAEGDERREVAFSDGDPVSVSAEPPLEEKPWSIDAAEQSGTVDPVTALLSVLAPGPRRALCGRRIEVFDGRHRFAFELDRPEPRGDGARCSGAHVRLAGYEPEKMGENARKPVTFSLSRRADGRDQVTRLQAETSLGMGVMSIRDE